MRATFLRVAPSLLFLLSLVQIPALVNGYIDWSKMQEDIFAGPGVGKIQETDFCDVVKDKSIPILDALKGRDLSIAVQYGKGFDFFIYDPNKPLSVENPTGMVATMLDELGRRGGFSWRNSFVAYNVTTVNSLVGEGPGKWDRMLNWTISNFDLSVDKWILTTERLENETVYLHSWFDAGLILVDQGDQAELNWLGFAAPFHENVWLAIWLTVLFSAVFMMVIETIEGRRDGRSYKWWLGDQLFYSNLAISQHFQFPNPKTGAGRVFLSSFAFWSMLVGATYTANLASLLVEDALASPINSIESAMENDLTICIHEGSASQSIMNSLIPKTLTYDNFLGVATPEDMYRSLTAGVCDILLGTRQEFLIFGSQQQYGCNLVQAGNELHSSSASFAIEFDPLNCDSVLAYVLNIHLNSIDVDGNLTKYWASYLDIIDDTCTSEEDEKMGIRRRMVETIDGKNSLEAIAKMDSSPAPLSRRNNRRRLIKSTQSSSIQDDGSDGRLTMFGMAGVFIVHAVGTGLSMLMALYSVYHKRKKHRSAAMGKGKHFRDSSFLESELNLKYLSMKRDMSQQIQTMKLDMMAQMDNFFELHRHQSMSASDSTAGVAADMKHASRRRLSNNRARTNPNVGQMEKLVHTTNDGFEKGLVHDDSTSSLQDL